MKFRSPVVFQALDKELDPVKPHLSGVILNAGCGARSLDTVLEGIRFKRVINADAYESPLDNFIKCDLSDIPLGSASVDTVLCNAVLEHYVEPELALKEFARVLTTEGILILSIPFLQPNHPTPNDYQRYTIQGLHHLLGKCDFKIIEARSVHTIFQTFGWILWDKLDRNGNNVLRGLCWLPIFLATYISSKLIRDEHWPLDKFTANTYQVVCKRNS